MKRSSAWQIMWCGFFMLAINSACKTTNRATELKVSRVDLLAMDIFEVTFVQSPSEKAIKIELDVTSNEVFISHFNGLQWSESQAVTIADEDAQQTMKYVAALSERPYPQCQACKTDEGIIFLRVFQGDSKSNYVAKHGNCVCDGDRIQTEKTMDYVGLMQLYQHLFGLFSK